MDGTRLLSLNVRQNNCYVQFWLSMAWQFPPNYEKNQLSGASSFLL